MNCPLCANDSRVIRTDITVRRRECVVCKHRFTTAEVLKDDLERRDRIIGDAVALAEKIAAGG